MVGGVSLGVDWTHRPDHGLGTIGEDGHVFGVSSGEWTLEGQHSEVVDKSSVQEADVVAATLKREGRGVLQRNEGRQ